MSRRGRDTWGAEDSARWAGQRGTQLELAGGRARREPPRTAPTPHLVVAYGSNLCEAQMRARCPDAVPAGACLIHGARLAFKGHSLRWGGAVADVEWVLRGVVHGELWRLSDADLRQLDAHEGNPRVYRRELVSVVDERGRGRRALAYVHRGGTKGLPSAPYLERIAGGYARLGFPGEALADAVLRSSPNPVTRAQAKVVRAAVLAAVRPAPLPF